MDVRVFVERFEPPAVTPDAGLRHRLRQVGYVLLGLLGLLGLLSICLPAV